MPDLDKEFPKLMEIHRNYDGTDPDNMLARIPEVLNDGVRSYLESEPILQRLSYESFEVFKSKILSRGKRDNRRGYHQFVDILHELLGYEYLEEQGYKRIEFLKEDQNGPSPDLAAYEEGKLACLLEVKRILESDVDVDAWQEVSEPEVHQERSGVVQCGLTEEFKNKIIKTVSAAREQMQSYSSSPSMGRIVYLIINMDLDYTLDRSNWDELTCFLEDVAANEPEIDLAWEYGGFGAPK